MATWFRGTNRLFASVTEVMGVPEPPGSMLCEPGKLEAQVDPATSEWHSQAFVLMSLPYGSNWLGSAT